MNENKSINWYPGHMAKTKREIKEILKLIDIVIYVVDARIPQSSLSLGLDSLIKNKKKLLVLSKYDLCDKSVTDKWINKFEKEGYIVVNANLKDSNDFEKIIKTVENMMIKHNEKRSEKGLLNAKAKALVLGAPNVGKSTLINKISGKNKVNVGNKPGVTKSLNWIRVNSNIDLLDTPGLLLPKIEAKDVALNLCAMTIIKEEIIPIDEVAVYILKMLEKYYKGFLKENYGIDEINNDDITITYQNIASFRGIKTKDEYEMYDRVSVLILNDIKSEKLKNITFDRIGD